MQLSPVAQTVESCLQGEIRKISPVCHLLEAGCWVGGGGGGGGGVRGVVSGSQYRKYFTCTGKDVNLF